MNKLLVVDDQRAICYSLKRFLEAEGYDVQTAASGEEALVLLNNLIPDLVIMDVRMPQMDGLEVLKKIKEVDPRIQVIMMTAFSTTEKAIYAMKLGAYDYIPKPFDNDELLMRVREALNAKKLMQEVVTFDEVKNYETRAKIIGKSPQMLEIYKQIGQVAQTDTPILIRGESGTGKELIARAIYHYSSRATKPFIAINCSAIPDQLLEAELFGYERGAFTGADFRRLGKFEQCNEGTIFFDEIGDMPLSLQAKLLRVLQDGEIQRLGSKDIVKTDVRIITATNKNLENLVKKGFFREDLYYRINVVNIHVPPLRERKEDIPALIQYFIQKYNKKINKTIRGITSESLEKLKLYHWPGNVRELENTIQRAMVFSKGDYLSIELPNSFPEEKFFGDNLNNIIEQLACLALKSKFPNIFDEVIRKVEGQMIKRALELTHGNQVQAAKILGIARNTLRKKLEEET